MWCQVKKVFPRKGTLDYVTDAARSCRLRITGFNKVMLIDDFDKSSFSNRCGILSCFRDLSLTDPTTQCHTSSDTHQPDFLFPPCVWYLEKSL